MVRDEYFPGTSIRIDRETPITDPNYGQDLCLALFSTSRATRRCADSGIRSTGFPNLAAVGVPLPVAAGHSIDQITATAMVRGEYH